MYARYAVGWEVDGKGQKRYERRKKGGIRR